MSTRTRMITSLLSVAAATLLLSAVLIGEIQGPHEVRAAEATPQTTVAPRPTGALTLDDFRQIARDVTPGVVNINTRRIVGQQRSDPFRDFFGEDLMDRFFGPQRNRQTQTNLGSGFVIDAQGHILTNRHVVDGADDIQVTMGDARKTYDAKLVGTDARTDVALLKIEPDKTLTVLSLGDSDKTEVAEWVMAIGSPFGLGSTVTVGVVSYVGRPLTLGTAGTTVDLIQTDASINPGNSGGPLLNTRGEVVGINTLIMTRGAMQSAGVGFAVPINVARRILPQLRETGRVTRGWLGVTIQSMTPDMARSFDLEGEHGAVITDLDSRGPSVKAGIEPGDVVLEIDGRPVEDSNDLAEHVSSLPPGQTVELKIFRQGEHKIVKVELGTFPDRGAARAAEERSSDQLGMTLRELTPELAAHLELPRGTRGVVVMDVEAGSPAEQAGLRRGHLIVAAGGRAVEDIETLEQIIEEARGKGLLRLRVRTNTGHTFVVLKIE